MRLRKPCPHDLYDEHPWDDWGEVAIFTCPGGQFLPEGALVVEKVDGEWPEWAMETLRLQVDLPEEILDALASQVGESE